MIGRNVKQALLDQVEPHAGPVLSLYLDVDPANPDNTQKAYVLRAAAAMREADLDKQFIARVTAKLEQEFVITKGRSLVIFASEDPEGLFNDYYLQTRLPLLSLTDGAMATWGRPFIAPLLYVLDQKQRCAVIYVDADRVRVFEAFLGQIEEIADYVRLVDTDDWRPYRNARRSPAVGIGVAARGGAAVDAFRDRMEEASARLYRSLLPQVESNLREEDIHRVILVGLPGTVSTFHDLMSSGMQQRFVGSVAPPANPDGPPADWLPLVSDLMASAEEEHENALLDRIRESGVWGQETLGMLQDNRIHTLVVPWSPAARVFRSESGRVSAGADEAQVRNPGEEILEVPLLQVLPDLVAQSGTALEFAQGAAETRLNEEFGGLAGITRW